MCLSSSWLIHDWSTERQNKPFKDYIRICLKKCNITFSSLEAFAADCDTWSSTCKKGLAALLAALDQPVDDRHTRRHATSDSTASGIRCLTCDRICASESLFMSTANRTPGHKFWHLKQLCKKSDEFPAFMCHTLDSALNILTHRYEKIAQSRTRTETWTQQQWTWDLVSIH